MTEIQFEKRRAVRVENDLLRVTATVEGGHIAEILHKAAGVNPLWIPPWPSIEPSTYDWARHPEYGAGAEARLLAGIMGHNICLDTFGAPSAEEMAAGMPVHGEGPVIPYECVADGVGAITLTGTLPLADLRFRRRIAVSDGSAVVRIEETVENLSASDRPIAWTQHVTLGPPFLEAGKTQFRMPATRSKTGEKGFNDDLGPYEPDAEFSWPFCPRKNGGSEDLRVYTKGPVAGGFSTHLLDPAREQAFFVAWSPSSQVLFGYAWRRSDFPWLARWEENCLRTAPPWNGRTTTCGMEFGVSPTVEARRNMVERGGMFGVAGYRWVPARAKLRANYCAFTLTADRIPVSIEWDGRLRLHLAHDC